MNKQDVISFFNAQAAHWDDEMIRNDDVIGTILDAAGIAEGDRVLDVACGTGVLLPDYLARQVGSVTGVDISAEMIRIAEEKFLQNNVTFLCADVETVTFAEGFDRIMVYNAFPHFPQPEQLIAHLSSLLLPGGSLTVAHGMSREAIDRRHHGAAAKVSVGLMPAEQLAEIFSKHLTVTSVISNDCMYLVSGVR